MRSFKIPSGIKLTLYEHCFSGEQQTFEGAMESQSGNGFGTIGVSSYKVEEIVGGCC